MANVIHVNVTHEARFLFNAIASMEHALANLAVEDLIVMSVRVDTPECGQIVSRVENVSIIGTTFCRE